MKSPPMARAALRMRLTLVAWSLHSHDSRVSDPDWIARRVLARVRSGDIVLLHDGHDLPGRIARARLARCRASCAACANGRFKRSPRPSCCAVRPEPVTSRPRAEPELLAANRSFYDALRADARLVAPERFNTWPLAARSP